MRNIILGLFNSLLLVVVILTMSFWILVQLPVVRLIQSISFKLQTPLVSKATILTITQESYAVSFFGATMTESKWLTNDEISHLKDVWNLVGKVRLMTIISWLLLLIIYLFQRTMLNNFLFTRVKRLLIIIIIGMSLGLIFFKNFFISFHHVLFPQGNWSFPKESALIQAYPQDFFILWYAFWLICMGLIAIFLHQLKRCKPVIKPNF